MPTVVYKYIGVVVVIIGLCAVSWFYGYTKARNDLQGIAQKEYAAAIEEAKKQGEQDKQLAEKATRKLIEKQGELNEILNREIPSNPGCTLSDDRLQQLREISDSTATD